MQRLSSSGISECSFGLCLVELLTLRTELCLVLLERRRVLCVERLVVKTHQIHALTKTLRLASHLGLVLLHRRRLVLRDCSILCFLRSLSLGKVLSDCLVLSLLRRLPHLECKLLALATKLTHCQTLLKILSLGSVLSFLYRQTLRQVLL